jgi:formylglycine-generating enzyme required for sulfatase activity
LCAGRANVSWNDATDFCRKLTELTSKDGKNYCYRLPTEAEWEFACRSGIYCECESAPGADELARIANYVNCSGPKTLDGMFLSKLHAAKNDPLSFGSWRKDCKPIPVGKKSPNSLGLHDMIGNVWELCFDVFGDPDSDREVDASGPLRGSHHVVRGGSYLDTEEVCNCFSRHFRRPEERRSDTGFRIVVELHSPQPHLRTTCNTKKLIEIKTATEVRDGEQFTNSLGMTFAKILPGSFLMGSLRAIPGMSTDSQYSQCDLRHYTMKMHDPERFALMKMVSVQKSMSFEEHCHQVVLTRSFFIGVHQVTQAQYEKIMGDNPSYFKISNDHPVESVSWFDANQFCERLNDLEHLAGGGFRFRLPTEAEWEYACRAGSLDDFCFGMNEDLLDQYAWFVGNSGKKIFAHTSSITSKVYETLMESGSGSTNIVGSKKPNKWGLFDMHGNVCEWCSDWAGPYADKVPYEIKELVDRRYLGMNVTRFKHKKGILRLRPRTWSCRDEFGLTQFDPEGPIEGKWKVLRGGSWCTDAERCRNAYRGDLAPNDKSIAVGFRVVAESIESFSQKRVHVKIVDRFEDDLSLRPSEIVENSIGMKFRAIPIGECPMKLPGNAGTVVFPIEDSYFVGLYPVTQSEFSKVMARNPSSFLGESLPVQNVTWKEAIEFCARLGSLISERHRGFQYRLPSEIEWEYACRAGSSTDFFFGNDHESLHHYGWYDRTSGITPIDTIKMWRDDPNRDRFFDAIYKNGCKPHSVGQKKPNEWGLFDLYGNVREWCSSWYGEYVHKRSTWLFGPDYTTEEYRVKKGGAFLDPPDKCSSCARSYDYATAADCATGFRVVLVVPDAHCNR